MANPSSHGIFISYRRDDSRADAGRLCDRLKAHFGEAQVFMDIDDIRPGQRFVDVLRRTLDECRVLIVLIGRGWLKARHRDGALRLFDQEDFVRMEIQSALQRGMEIIPVLVARASMPTREELPPALGSLAGRQAIEISDTRFHQDVDRLVQVLDGFAAKHPGRARKWAKPGILIAVAALAAALLWLAVFSSPFVPSQSGSPKANETRAGATSAGVVALRSEPAAMTSTEVKAMLVEKNFFDASWYPAGTGLEHDYQPTVIGGHPLIIDRRTNLMWQQAGSERAFSFDDASAYIQTLNERSHAGHGDWRLPTLEESLSLLTPDSSGDGHVSAHFSWRSVPFTWTSDRAGQDAYWVVYLRDGIGRPERSGFNAWARAVRTMQ
jgi:hypothetical protein